MRACVPACALCFWCFIIKLNFDNRTSNSCPSDRHNNNNNNEHNEDDGNNTTIITTTTNKTDRYTYSKIDDNLMIIFDRY